MPSSALGPHVVGERVVVRRIVPGETGPTGGPAFTDLLGVCTSWADGLCVVQPETGPAVEIPVDLIVSGKPVPPRPSMRLRVSAREAEEHALAMWPRVEQVALGSWVLRSDPHPVGRLIKRANSVLAMGDPGVPVDEAVETVRGFYESRQRPVLAQVEAASDVEKALRAAGWTELERGEAHFQLVSLAALSRALRQRGQRGRGGGSGSPGDSDQPHATGAGAQVLVEIGRDEAAGRAIAEGRAALDGDWLGLHGLGVLPKHRRRGLAQDVLAALADWGAEQGALTAWLHVETDNAPALALYERLGFVTHHTCRYLTPGTSLEDRSSSGA